MKNTTLLASAVAACCAVSFTTGTFAASTESWSSCTASLCIDAAPQGKDGADGSGGWGWDTKAKAPVSTLKVGVPANFTVTVLQPNPICVPGSITLTYSSPDFSLNIKDSAGNVGTDPFDRGGVAVFSYDGNFFCHGDQSMGFAFTPLGESKDGAFALVTATITVNGQQASGTYPVTIKK